jgi:DNA-binding response OmpR family regulator
MTGNTARIKVLLVEDDLDLAAGIGDYLSARGLSIDFAYSAAQARAQVLADTPDVLVLDVNLPGRDGISLCRELKNALGLKQPVLFLTASGSLADKLLGFEAGAVDYIVKPFEPAELLARIIAITSHVSAAGGAQLRVGEYVLDLRRHVLTCSQTRLQLHTTGHAILRRLMEAHPGSVTTGELCETLWGDARPQSEPLRAHIYHLRQALLATFGQTLIVTVRGVGYRFESDSDIAPT